MAKADTLFGVIRVRKDGVEQYNVAFRIHFGDGLIKYLEDRRDEWAHASTLNGFQIEVALVRSPLGQVHEREIYVRASKDSAGFPVARGMNSVVEILEGPRFFERELSHQFVSDLGYFLLHNINKEYVYHLSQLK